MKTWYHQTQQSDGRSSGAALRLAAVADRFSDQRPIQRFSDSAAARADGPPPAMAVGVLRCAGGTASFEMGCAGVRPAVGETVILLTPPLITIET